MSARRAMSSVSLGLGWRFAAAALAALLAVGCTGPAALDDPGKRLPFSVRVAGVRVSEGAPPVFGNPEELAVRFSESLEEAGIFTRVVPRDDLTTAADLEVDVVISGDSFGPGRPTAGGAVFSTIVWLTVGHLAWLIDNREYVESSMVLNVVIRPRARRSAGAQARPVEPVFADVLPLKGLQLSFLERADMKYWFFSLLIPPWIGDGDPSRAAANLARRVTGFFRDHEPERLLLSFPSSYFRSSSRYLIYTPERPEVVIVSPPGVQKIAIQAEGQKPRLLDDPNVLDLLPVEGPEEEALRRLAAVRIVDMRPTVGDRYYRVPLLESETGFIRVGVSPSEGGVPSMWTIHRPGVLAGPGPDN